LSADPSWHDGEMGGFVARESGARYAFRTHTFPARIRLTEWPKRFEVDLPFGQGTPIRPCKIF